MIIYISLIIILLIIAALSLTIFKLRPLFQPPKFNSELLPADYNLPYENKLINGINTYLITSPEAKDKIIIFLHGYQSNSSDLLPLATRFWPDFSLLMVDLRYFGKSRGRMTTLGIKEVKDLNIIIEYLKTRNYKRIGVFGFSLGGAIALLSSKNKNIKTIATYGAFANLIDVAEKIYPPYKYYGFMADILSLIFLGQRLSTISPLETIKDTYCPILLSHSKNDNLVPFSQAEKIAENNEAIETFFSAQGSHTVFPADYYDKLKEFFHKNL